MSDVPARACESGGQGRVWLIGMNNPYQAAGADPEHRYALYPLPERSAGGRLCSVILGMQRTEYLRTFVRRNLIDGPKWSVPKAREAAKKILAEAGDEDVLVLCGEKVAAAFGVEYEVCAKHYLMRVPRVAAEALVIPHPSGLSQAWNKPGVIGDVREAVRALVFERSKERS